MQKYIGDKLIDEEYLKDHPHHIFIFGDNLQGVGQGGAAKLRYHPQSYGFITKKYPSNQSNAFYDPNQYKEVFEKELSKLISDIELNKNLIFLITPLGSGLANKYKIWENVIRDGLRVLEKYDNVVFLYNKP